ncbi:MAG: CARDB domain-containing protein [Sulfuricaulis sp.]|uniref:CARDB domain-containing protein n=1 Tax=Sulfuricaulis sp. TaxID=2003553 RepID=UPI0034A301DB
MNRLARAFSVIAIIFVTGGLFLPKAASPNAACCAVTTIAQNGLITAKEAKGARTFQFRVADPAQRSKLRVGAPVYANFDTKQVSLDGKKTCCTILKISTAAKQPVPGTAPAAPKNKPGGTTTPTRQTTTVQVPKVDVTASEGSTATAIRGKPATSTKAETQAASGTTQVGSQTQALNPEIMALRTSSDLVVKDLAFNGLGEITFNLVNRGEVGINVPAKQGSAVKMAAPAPPSGPPISIDIWMGTSKITVQQPSMGGKQTKNFKVPIPSNYSKPKCLETRNLKVVVDPQNQVKELHDDNNVAEAPNSGRPCPDLAIKSIKRDYSGLLKETYTPKVTIINQGNAPSPSTQVWGTSLPGGVWPVTGWPELVPTHTIPALAPGQTTSFHIGGSVVSANHTAIRIILDRHFQIEESNESNNFKDERL